MSENKRATAATSADADEAPELTDEFFDRADLLEGTKVVRRGRGPQKAPRKVVTTLRLDPDIVEAFRHAGRGWQSRINAALREWITTHRD